MGQRQLPGNPPIELTLRRSRRARRISLRVSDLDGKVTLTLPAHVAEREALAFARDKADWIRAAQARRQPTGVIGIGSAVPFLGRDLPVRAAPRAAITDDAILVPDNPARLGARLTALLKEAARARIAPAVATHAGALGRRAGRITLRDTRSRWGSCTTRGDLMFSWRLVMAPPEVLDYVVAHEVAHLVEMNHSPAFWALVEQLRPTYASERRWLREHGSRLHRVRLVD